MVSSGGPLIESRRCYARISLAENRDRLRITSPPGGLLAETHPSTSAFDL
jgi:hypothetical protein